MDARAKKEFFNNLLEAVNEPPAKPRYLSRLPFPAFLELNALRKRLGEEPIRDRLIFLYPNVARKLQRKRLHLDHMTAHRLAECATQALFAVNSTLLPTRFDYIQHFFSLRGTTQANAFVGRAGDGTISLKSTYTTRI